MFKTIAISATLILPVLVASVAPAQADHGRSKRWVEPNFFNSVFEDDSYDPRYDGRFLDEVEDDVLLVPRRKRMAREDYIDELYDYEEEMIVPRVKKAKPKTPAKTVAKSVAKPVAKPKLVQVTAVSKSVVKPVKKSPIAVAPIIKPVPKAPVLAAKPLPTVPAKQARLTLPVEDRPSVVAPKTTRVVPSAPINTTTISCEKASAIVTGYGFTSVSPLICVGKTYRFKALRDGKNFEINLSAASGELTEVKKL